MGADPPCIFTARDESLALRISNSGSRMEKVAPQSRPRDVTSKVPPCCMQMPLLMNSPRPDPCPACSWFALNCTPSAPISSSCAGERPTPVSVTDTRTAPARGCCHCWASSGVMSICASASAAGSHSAWTETQPSVGVNLSALDMRLRKTCDMRIESPTTCSAWYWVSSWADASQIAPVSKRVTFFSLACMANPAEVFFSTCHMGTEENSRRSVPDSILS
mmetsp:Transcript_13122/g.29348  ORF Transcript_13122/g.29348 Transcript_13122/m.29348 type:complete len:220 (-) Transcript_13122:58-717(-)